MSDVDVAIDTVIEMARDFEQASTDYENGGSKTVYRETMKAAEQARAALRALLTPTITPAEIEAGANVLWVHGGYQRIETWGSPFIPEHLTEDYRTQARTVLEAAARQRATGSGVG